MKINAIYPGTFDPITFGHIDVIKKALKIFDTVVVAISETDNKNYFFNAQERMNIVKKALFLDLKYYIEGTTCCIRFRVWISISWHE